MQRRILAIGVFDLFHVGHLRYLQLARTRGEHLTVGVTPDAICAAVKGKRPLIGEAQRLEIIRGLGWVDAVRLLPTSTEETEKSVAWMTAWQVNHVVVGGGWLGSARWQRLLPALAACRITVEFAPQTDGVSTTQIMAAMRGLRERGPD